MLQPSCATQAASLPMRSTSSGSSLFKQTCSAWASATQWCATMMAESCQRCWVKSLWTGSCLMLLAAGLVSLQKTPQSRYATLAVPTSLQPSSGLHSTRVCCCLMKRISRQHFTHFLIYSWSVSHRSSWQLTSVCASGIDMQQSPEQIQQSKHRLSS